MSKSQKKDGIQIILGIFIQLCFLIWIFVYNINKEVFEFPLPIKLFVLQA